MINRLLPAEERRRREVIFAKGFTRILVLTTRLLEAHGEAHDDPQLDRADLAIDAALGASMAYDALYWIHPCAFRAKSDSYLLAFVVRCAAVAIEREILRVQAERGSSAYGSDSFEYGLNAGRPAAAGLGFSLI
jgi:hypothetical protein